MIVCNIMKITYDANSMPLIQVIEKHLHHLKRIVIQDKTSKRTRESNLRPFFRLLNSRSFLLFYLFDFLHKWVIFLNNDFSPTLFIESLMKDDITYNQIISFEKTLLSNVIIQKDHSLRRASSFLLLRIQQKL